MRLTVRYIPFFALVAFFAVIADQYVKSLIVEGFRWQSDYLSIVFVLNEGVAFSMLSFLEGYLKYIQIAVLLFVAAYSFYEGYMGKYWAELGLIIGSGASNVYDRFVFGGVVDYVYYHHWFEFAVFNLADVLIDIGVASILIRAIRSPQNR